MQRRTFLRSTLRSTLGTALGGACAWSSFSATAHTPYNQWRVYRRKHLLIGCHKQDMRTYDLAKELAETLKTHLPDSKARVARAPTAKRLASLLGTDQLDVAILENKVAIDMAAGVNGFEPYGEIALRALYLLPEHTLVSRAAIPDHHAWLVTSTLFHENPSTTPEREPPVLWHPGAERFRQGLGIPPSIHSAG